MNQLIFDFADHSYPGFDKFLGQSNGELLDVLQNQQHQQPFVFVWGQEGSGKSHLLRAWVAQAGQAGLQAAYVDAKSNGLGDWARQFDCVAVDQIEHLSAEEQIKLFALFNHFSHSGHGSLLLSATVPPAQLVLREDLRTRMGLCVVYQIQPLSDEEKADALMSMAQARQLPVDEEVFRYLLNHWSRDLDRLIHMLDTLDDYALAMGRRITLPLLRGLLKQQETL
ncbi:DnaA regulatory inactivator Hda [Paralysiella testudinis]|uniref:DnaA regulatory inactivator Hda n=1 Tax=Paralysiella testudinis TaxID=2809020 RepID=A0A892ZKN1_9NEIS|nr:DnaA regulatory inactivator Hda [Paralysiella testudinis]QRQ81449.1 DnaA regulatory inactivator Hda [Paralysiella testudinis]